MEYVEMLGVEDGHVVVVVGEGSDPDEAMEDAIEQGAIAPTLFWRCRRTGRLACEARPLDTVRSVSRRAGRAVELTTF